MKNKLIPICLTAFIMFSCSNRKGDNISMNGSDDAPFSYTVETVVADLDIPWGIDFLPDGTLLITEKKGELLLHKDGETKTIAGMPDVVVRGQGGLMDVAVDPDYESNGWIYLSYASDLENDGKGANTTIARAKLDNMTLVDLEVLYKATPNTKRGQHFGSRIEFDTEGYLYFTIGDRGNRDVNPQDLTRDGGKVYRINRDGSIPEDNPFMERNNAKTAIYSYGHRNPQGMARHPETGEIWTHEHGPQGGDEINIIEAGKNYGWPRITYGINYSGTKITDDTSLPGMEQPLHYWDPSIAPSGMAFVTGDIYPNWRGNLLVGSLKFQYVNRVTLEGNKVVGEEKIVQGLGRVRSICTSPDGYIFVGIENKGVVRILPD
jgi:glucose/arabinose dehydrogenase